MADLGKYHTLKISEFFEQGAYLVDDEETERVLLPNRYVPEGAEVGLEIEVFLYTDSEDRRVATTEKPKIILNEFAFLEVVAVTSHGAFVDWGLPKDLFVSFKHQINPLKMGGKYCIALIYDKVTDRLCGTTKINHLINNDLLTVAEEDEVDILVHHATELGYSVIVNKKHWGMLYSNEVFRTINPGDELKGWVKKIRDDNKLDLSLQKYGVELIETTEQALLDKLKDAGGFLPLHDKSDPFDIEQALHISKKVFKKSVGALYRKRKITISDSGISLVE